MTKESKQNDNQVILVFMLLLMIQLLFMMKCSVPGFITVFNKMFNPGKMPKGEQSNLICQVFGVLLFVSIISTFIRAIKQ